MKIKNTTLKTACCFSELPTKYFLISFDEKNTVRLERLLIERLVYLIETMEVTHFISGIDLGVEQFVAEIVLGLKRNYPEITLECVIPYEDQAANWTIAQRNKYFSIMERCDKETLLQRRNSKDCIRKKIEYMVKKSNNVLVVGNSKSGGIGKIVAFARTLGKTVILIDLNPFEVGTGNI